MTATTDNIQSAINAGQAIGTPKALNDAVARFFSVVVPEGGDHIVVDLEEHLDTYRDQPRRKKGTQTVHDPAAFIAYLAKHALPETEVWADVTQTRITALINANRGTFSGAGALEDLAGWGDHRVTYALKPTPAWAAWLTRNGNMMSQLEFAELVEDQVIDFADPAGAVMLEIAQTFTASRSGKFESSKRLKSGETTLEYREEIDARAGSKKDIAIPDTFTLGIIPFEGSAAYKITARLRFRIHDGQLRLGYRLERPEDVTRAAFTDVVAAIDAEIRGDVWSGVAP